jgi:predicted MFS family arabinose efflux permease
MRALRDRYGASLARYLLAATLFSVGFAVFWGPIPAYLTEVGFEADTVFVLFLLTNLGSATVFEPAGSLASERDPRRLQLAALAIRVVLYPLVAVLGALLGVVALGVSFGVIGVTWAVIAVTATGLVTRLATGPLRGEVLGIYSAILALGTGIGSALGGVAATSLGYLFTFALASAFVVVGAALVVQA